MKTLVCAFLYNRKELLREERGKPMFWDKVAGVYDLFENLYNKKYTGRQAFRWQS